MYTACITMRVAIHRTKKVTKIQQLSCSTAELGQQKIERYREVHVSHETTHDFFDVF
jgi:hypothetical protein